MAALSRGGGGDDKGAAFDPVGGIMQGISDGNSIAALVRLVMFWVARGLILPMELIFRRQIGERYITAPVVGVFGLILFVVSSMRIINGAGVFVMSFVVGFALIIHWQHRSFYQRRGVHWHSYSEGVSLLHVPALMDRHRKVNGPFSTLDVAKNFLEPLAVLFACALTAPAEWVSYLFHNPLQATYSFPLTMYLLTTAMAMTGYQLYCAGVRRGQLLDYLDAQVMLDAHRESDAAPPTQGMRQNRGVAYLPTNVVPKWGRETGNEPPTVNTTEHAATEIPNETTPPHPSEPHPQSIEGMARIEVVPWRSSAIAPGRWGNESRASSSGESKVEPAPIVEVSRDKRSPAGNASGTINQPGVVTPKLSGVHPAPASMTTKANFTWPNPAGNSGQQTPPALQYSFLERIIIAQAAFRTTFRSNTFSAAFRAACERFESPANKSGL